jgi:hypothetical protein
MRAWGVAASCLVLLSCTAGRTVRSDRSPGSLSPNQGFPQLTFAKLLEISKASPTMEDALETLSLKYPAYMQSHTLVYDSLSIQQSTFAEPRVLVFGPFAKFVFSWNGRPNYYGGNSFETMEFDEDSGDFKFREITFKNPSQGQAPDADDIESENENVAWSKPNINKCTQCHGKNPSPIFDTYFIWPGFYGSNDDFLTTQFYRDEIKKNANYRDGGLDKVFGTSQGREVKLKDGVVDVEVEGFKKYIAGKHSHVRYKFLPDRAVDKGYFRLLAGERPESIDVSDEVRKESELFHSVANYIFDGRPNLFFGDQLNELMAKKFIKQLAAKKETALVPFTLAYFDYCAGDRHYSPKGSAPSVEDYANHWKRDPLIDARKVLSESTIKQIRKRAGPWKTYARKFLFEELATEAEKISRMESSFGKNSFVAAGKKYGSVYDRPSEEFFKRLGRKLSRTERIVTQRQTDNLYIEARNAYIAKGLGVDLSEYVTNLRRARTFREGGFYMIAERVLGLNRKAGMEPGERDKACADLTESLVMAK